MPARLLHAAADASTPPLHLHLCAWRVLKAAGDERADAVLQRARQELGTRASRIPDAGTRGRFMQIAEHRAISGG